MSSRKNKRNSLEEKAPLVSFGSHIDTGRFHAATFLSLGKWEWGVSWGVCATCLSQSIGTKFITSYMQNYNTQTAYLALQITGVFDQTTVTVSVPCNVCGKEFTKTITVYKGKLESVVLPPSIEIRGSKVFPNVVRISADKDISVVSLNSKPLSTEIAQLFPMSLSGTEHYVVTPTGGPTGYFPEFAVLSYEGPNVVDLYLTAQVAFNGQTYAAGSKLTITLQAFQGIQLQATGDLSGTRIVSQTSVVVLAGHTCSWKYNKCNHVFEQLQPVKAWGKNYIVPPIPWQAKSDIVFISASQTTAAILNGGQVLPINLLPKTALFVQADVPFQVLFYSTGAVYQNLLYDTFLIGIPDTSKYSQTYSVIGQAGFVNFAILVVETEQINGLLVGGQPLPTLQWTQIPGTVFSWALYQLQVALVPYRVEHPNSPFGLLIVGHKIFMITHIDCCQDCLCPLSCSQVLCQKGLECKMINGAPHCVPASNGTCWIWGDPHYNTFDKHKYDFQGTCTYTIAKTCGNNFELPSFHIYAKNGNRGSKRVSYVDMVTIEVYGYTITITRSENGFVKVNGIRAHLPIYLNGGSLQIFQSGGSAVVVTEFHLRMSYDWNQQLRITVSSALQGSLCGLCGNYNDDPKDDFQTPAGTIAPDANAFGKSWKVNVGDQDTCWDDCHGPCVPCQADQAQKYQSEQYCGLIKAPSGPFSPCHSKVDPGFYLEGCVYDVCANEGHRQSVCDALESYADACQKHGVQIGEWRKLAGCLPQCPPNSQYQQCGTACPATCLDEQTQQQLLCPLVCVEGCHCLPGYVLSQGKCIPKSSCGCLHEGYLYAPNEGFWADDKCTKRCVCNPATNRVECTQQACKSSEKCLVIKGVRDCYPIDFVSCKIHGDPHYFTFDKYKFDFQGPCAYVLTEVCVKTMDLNWFGVYVQNEYRGSRAVSWTRSVQINVHGIEIIISRQYPGKVLVGGILTCLPYNAVGNRVKIYRKGPSAVVETNFGLTVSFNWDHQLTVTVPGTYRNTLCGLCGNFNNIPADDALVPGGILVPTIPVFGAKGTKAFDPSCKQVVDPTCPGVDILANQQRASGRECGLIVAVNGPFRECHGHVDQEAAFQDCIYDSCYLKGRYAFVCAAIANYVSACQAAGITIYPWRTPTFCPPRCSANSHYELCAKECDQACSSLYFPAPCPTKCQENCVCNDNFVRSNDVCVPMAMCGCLYQGRYYPVSEVFYPTCQERCVCQAGGKVVCEATPCGPNEVCQLQDGHQKCYPTGSATCSLVGDLYLTFDGLPFNFQGTCSYILSKSVFTTKVANLPPFTVVVQNQVSGNGNIAVPKVVTVEMLSFELSLLQDKWGYVNGVLRRLPVNLLDGKLRIFQHGFYQRIEAFFGVTVIFDLSFNVRITVPNNYKDQLGGLCGNYNGQPQDDLQLPDGTVVSDVARFAAAWKIQTPGIFCTDGCSGKNCPICTEAKKEFFKQRSFCGILTATDGPFSSCHGVVDPTAYLNHCVFDLCIGGGDRQILCHSIQSYVAACQGAKVTIQPWRSLDFCPITCTANSHYTTCSNICEVTCAGLTDHLPCPETCVEGCQCDDGFFSDGLKCIPMDECGCFEDNVYYPPNVPVLQNNCKEKCLCSPGGFFCEDHACAANENCVTKDGVMQCQNIDPCKVKLCRAKETCQVKDGQAVCVPDYTGHCWCWGDPHCHTFDGYSYDFQGTCSYVLVQSTGVDQSLVPFSVVIKNENRGDNKAVSYVKLVSIRVYEQVITIHKQENGRVRVNGVTFNLPITLLGGKIRIFSSGNFANVQIDFGLLMTYDWNWKVDAHLSSSYYGNVGGLCGNFNQLPGDELRSPEDFLMPNVIIWATSWKVEDGDPLCFDECSGKCPTCDQQQLAKYKTDGHCGIVSVSNGPFQDCHATLDPNIILDNCALDVCMNGGDHGILCQAVNSYAEACQTKGRQVGDWRTPINCPLPCPENSHYVKCGSRCPATCSTRNTPFPCTLECVETCQCNDGYILSADKCVPIESCGCTHKGVYYKPEEEFWNKDCTLRCKCDSKFGAVVCSLAACQTGEQCKLVNGVQGCYSSTSTCISAGNYQYTTFDGYGYRFEGRCIYQLSKVCLPRPDLTPFDLSAQNNVAEGRAVILNVYGKSIIVRTDQVDGNPVNLPFNYEEKIKVHSDGHQFVIETQFGLVVKLFKENLNIETTAPSNFAGHLCGLCGNANGNLADETMQEYGENWFVGCSPSCSPKCPPCSSAELESYQQDSFCGLLNRPNGPFASCHGTIPVAPFFDECIKKTCEVRGQKNVWCDVIATYVAACQARSIPLQNWRTDSFCPQYCPANSQYELCGTRCAATCENPQLPLMCRAPCGEGCICRPGFILNGNLCVPLQECVCEFEGIYYKKGEEFFSNVFCRKRCRCMEDATVQCHDFCSDEDACKVVNDVSVCFPREPGTCYALDGWNYVTFDGVQYSLPVLCSYVLAQSDERHKFSIVLSAGLTGIEEIQSCFLRLIAQVNEERLLLPTDFGDVSVRQEGKVVLVRNNFGLRVFYDHNDWVAVSVSGTYQGLLKGLCGNFNKDKNDEFLLPGGKPVQDLTEFGNFWKIEGSRCLETCKEKCSVCDSTMEAKFQSKEFCGLIQAVPGPFSRCHAIVNPDHYFKYCVARLCSSYGATESLCQSLQAYATACQLAGATIDVWRPFTPCAPLNCLPGTHYEPCARNCKGTCARDLVCVDPCVEGCVCNMGTLANGVACVTPEQCGCWYEGSYISPDCKTKCTCESPGQVLFPQAHLYSAGRRRLTKYKMARRCVPQSSATCWARGDPHYQTFDMRKYDFMGTCTYTVAKTCGPDTTLPAFNVTIKNENRGVKTVSYVGLVMVQVYGYDIVVARKEHGFVRVNNQRFRLPIFLIKDKLWLFQSGTSVIIETDFAMRITYDWNSNFAVKISSSFFENVCGLCGDYNGKPEDDFRIPSGSLAPGLVEFGQSWKVEDGDPLCWSDCHGKCKNVTEEQLIKYTGETFCGWISKKGGPFSKCHSLIEPGIFVENCAYDLFFYKGHREALCQALKSYVDACQQEGGVVLDWRNLVGCPFSCPENSVYKICGSVCPATCSNELPLHCSSSQCVESCQCKDGFVMDAGKCIPRTACGCLFEGRLLAPSEEFWGDSTCTKRCACNPQTKKVTCQATKCSQREQCQVKNGIQNCYPVGYGTCSAIGHSHYHSFDGHSFNFQGTCLYRFAGLSQKRQGLVDFQILVQNSPHGGWSGTPKRMVKIEIYNQEITISWASLGRIMINGQLTNLPYKLGPDQIVIYQKGWDMVIQTDFSLVVTVSWQSHLTVTVPTTYQGALSGLCGNFNGDKQDDMTLIGGGQVTKLTAFGQLWKVAEFPGCGEVSPKVCPDLQSMAQKQRSISTGCGLLVDKNGPFRECHGKINPEMFFLDCIYDYCTSNSQISALGYIISAYASACQVVRVTIYIWRIHIDWKLVCPPNSHYELCSRSCQQTCDSLYSSLPCSTYCTEGCVCDEGFVLSGDRCVPLDECGCNYQDRYYMSGQTFYPTSTCNIKCTCQTAGVVICQKSSCGPNEECKMVDGVQKCHPMSSATCSASGDPHYLSFDGVPFDFQGTCAYILAKTTVESMSDLIPFTIVTVNEAKILEICMTVAPIPCLLPFQVNGIFRSLPIELSEGHLKAYQHGTKVLIRTSFGLLVSYDLVYHVRITVPSSYQKQMQGLCGNYNGKKDDEFLLPSGKKVTDVAVFGASWKVSVIGAEGPCSDGCSGSNCPTCDEEKKKVFKQRNYCGILTASDGPLKGCHSKVNPTVFFNDCIYDLCQSSGNSQALCQSIQSYVSACQEAKVLIQPWRSPSFCPMSCPPNSHYEECADFCTADCSGLRICPDTCAEGCQCDLGYFFDGLGCVSVDGCGCFGNGSYYRVRLQPSLESDLCSTQPHVDGDSPSSRCPDPNWFQESQHQTKASFQMLTIMSTRLSLRASLPSAKNASSNLAFILLREGNPARMRTWHKLLGNLLITAASPHDL
uniref:VWFD domain-containing protein n=1 Tax=Naja naja TaxID=35670 RepID=A0A8C7E3Z3_NAJNA